MKSVFDMSGVERAAALMVALGPRTAADIMKHLDEESIEKLSREIARIERLSAGDREELIGGFLIDLRKEKRRLQGGEGAARDILMKSFGRDKADQILSKFVNIDVDKEFAGLNEIEDDVLASFFTGEHPQTIAVALSFLAPAKSAGLLKALGPDTAREVAVRMAKMDKVMPDAVAGIVKTIKKKYQEYRRKNQGLSTGGLSALTEILKHMDADDERKIMQDLSMTMPAVSEQVQNMTYSFDNVTVLNNQEIRILIDEVGDDHILAKALKGAGDDVRFKFLRNMSQNRATDILSDMKAMGPIKLSEVEDCRNIVVTVMRKLDENGVISFRGGGDTLVR